jgi:GNAT superfamily N-acetyltransferase
MTTLPDTLSLNDQALQASADRILAAARAMGRPHRHDDDLAVAWQGDRGFFTNVAYVLRSPEDWDDLLRRAAGVVPPGRPLSLISAGPVPARLAGEGWQFVGHPPLMVRPAGGDAPPRPAELTIVDVVDDPGLEVFERTLIGAYPDGTLLPYRWGDVHDGRVLGGATRLFTGSVAGCPVATAAGHVAAGVNLVEMVATAADARGRGYGAALTWTAGTIGPQLPSVLIASDLGRPVYEALGYRAVDRWTFWHRSRLGR